MIAINRDGESYETTDGRTWTINTATSSAAIEFEAYALMAGAIIETADEVIQSFANAFGRSVSEVDELCDVFAILEAQWAEEKAEARAEAKRTKTCGWPMDSVAADRNGHVCRLGPLNIAYQRRFRRHDRRPARRGSR